MKNSGTTVRALSLGLLLGLCALTAHAQNAENSMTNAADSTGGNAAEGHIQRSSVNLLVNVREPSGFPVEGTATITVSCPLEGFRHSAPSVNSGIVTFNAMPAGDCDIKVEAPGYKTATDRTTVPPSVSAFNQNVFIYLHPASEAGSASARPNISPALMKEIDKSMEALRKDKFDDAQKHLAKAMQISPNNADVYYLMGDLALKQKNQTAAEQNFQRAVSLNPGQLRSLMALGQLQAQMNQPAPAIQTLKQALQLDGSSWRTNFYLATAYAQHGEYDKAQQYADRAVQLGGDGAGGSTHTMLGQILAAQGNKAGAREEFETVLSKYPNDPSAEIAKTHLANLDKAPGVSASARTGTGGPMAGGSNSTGSDLETVNAASSVALPGSAVHAAWAPPNVDEVTPGVAPDVACSVNDVVKQAAMASDRTLQNFEKFLATEHIEHQELDADGVPKHIRTHDFTYLIFVEKDKDGSVFLNEKRDGGTGVESFPTSLATLGLMGLGVDVFQPGFAHALDFKCEGLGQWRGKAAWIVHFSQKPDQKSWLRLWETKTQTVEIPLKGRVWVAASSFDVLHLETDLREPVKTLELERDHLSIDYGLVDFPKGKTQLWLPWDAEMYMELHGHRYHHKHTLTDYAIFAVDVNNDVKAPKNVPTETPEDPEKKTPQP